MILHDDVDHFFFIIFFRGWQWQDQLIFEFDGDPTRGQGGPMENLWVSLVAVAVTFHSDFEWECACRKFQQESQTNPPLSKIYAMFCKNTSIFTLIHA